MPDNVGIAACMRLNAKLTKQRDELYAALKQLRAAIRSDSRMEGYLVLTVDSDRALPICDAALAKADAPGSVDGDASQ